MNDYMYRKDQWIGTSLTSLPAGLKVEGELDLRYCTSLTSLPDGLQVGGILRLNGCTSLTSLPSGLQVGEYLDLSGCTSLRSLPADLKVGAGSSVYLYGCTLYPFDTYKFDFDILGYKIIERAVHFIMEE